MVHQEEPRHKTLWLCCWVWLAVAAPFFPDGELADKCCSVSPCCVASMGATPVHQACCLKPTMSGYKFSVPGGSFASQCLALSPESPEPQLWPSQDALLPQHWEYCYQVSDDKWWPKVMVSMLKMYKTFSVQIDVFTYQWPSSRRQWRWRLYVIRRLFKVTKRNSYYTYKN